MPYSMLATSKTPALVVYLIDVSQSMEQILDGAPKIDHVNKAIERILIRMVQRSTKGDVISPRYRLSLILYSDGPIDILGKIETITEVAKRGRPKLGVSNATNTADAFAYVRDLLKRELPAIKGHPAPMVCHLTDGYFNGDDPEPIVKDIMSLESDDGPVLVENVYLGPRLTKVPIDKPEEWPGVRTVEELDDQYAAKLFAMSSALPASYAEMIREEGYSLAEGARMLIPGVNKDLIELGFAMSGATPRA